MAAAKGARAGRHGALLTKNTIIFEWIAFKNFLAARSRAALERADDEHDVV